MFQKMETLEENQREALLCRRRQGRHTEEVPVMDLRVAQTLAELQDLEEYLKVLEFRKSDAVMKWKTGLGEKAVELLIADTLKHAHSKQARANRQDL